MSKTVDECQWMKCCVLCVMAVTLRHFFPANLPVLSQTDVGAIAMGSLLEHPWAPRASNRRKEANCARWPLTQIDCYFCWCFQHNSLQLELVDYLHNFSLNNFTAIWDAADLELLALHTTPPHINEPHLTSGEQQPPHPWDEAHDFCWCASRRDGFLTSNLLWEALRSGDGPADTAPVFPRAPLWGFRSLQIFGQRTQNRLCCK